MTKFETILKLAEIKGFMIMAGDIPLEINDSDMIYAETLSAIDNLIDDLSEEFQEKQDEIKLPKLTDYESYDDNIALSPDHDKLSDNEINQLINMLRNHGNLNNKTVSF